MTVRKPKGRKIPIDKIQEMVREHGTGDPYWTHAKDRIFKKTRPKKRAKKRTAH